MQWIDGIDVVVDKLFEVIGRDLLSRIQAQTEKIRDLPVVSGCAELIAVLAGVSAHAFVHDEFADSGDAATSKIEAGFRNFFSSTEDFILHFCVLHYFCVPGSVSLALCAPAWRTAQDGI